MKINMYLRTFTIVVLQLFILQSVFIYAQASQQVSLRTPQEGHSSGMNASHAEHLSAAHTSNRVNEEMETISERLLEELRVLGEQRSVLRDHSGNQESQETELQRQIQNRSETIDRYVDRTIPYTQRRRDQFDTQMEQALESIQARVERMEALRGRIYTRMDQVRLLEENVAMNQEGLGWMQEAEGFLAGFYAFQEEGFVRPELSADLGAEDRQNLRRLLRQVYLESMNLVSYLVYARADADSTEYLDAAHANLLRDYELLHSNEIESIGIEDLDLGDGMEVLLDRVESAVQSRINSIRRRTRATLSRLGDDKRDALMLQESEEISALEQMRDEKLNTIRTNWDDWVEHRRNLQSLQGRIDHLMTEPLGFNHQNRDLSPLRNREYLAGVKQIRPLLETIRGLERQIAALNISESDIRAMKVSVEEQYHASFRTRRYEKLVLDRQSLSETMDRNQERMSTHEEALDRWQGQWDRQIVSLRRAVSGLNRHSNSYTSYFHRQNEALVTYAYHQGQQSLKEYELELLNEEKSRLALIEEEIAQLTDLQGELADLSGAWEWNDIEIQLDNPLMDRVVREDGREIFVYGEGSEERVIERYLNNGTNVFEDESGRRVYVADGRVQRIILGSESEQIFTYHFNLEQEIIGIRIQEGNDIRDYRNGYLLRWQKESGYVFIYEDGQVQRVLNSDGDEVLNVNDLPSDALSLQDAWSVFVSLQEEKRRYESRSTTRSQIQQTLQSIQSAFESQVEDLSSEYDFGTSRLEGLYAQREAVSDNEMTLEKSEVRIQHLEQMQAAEQAIANRQTVLKELRESLNQNGVSSNPLVDASAVEALESELEGFMEQYESIRSHLALSDDMQAEFTALQTAYTESRREERRLKTVYEGLRVSFQQDDYTYAALSSDQYLLQQWQAELEITQGVYQQEIERLLADIYAARPDWDSSENMTNYFSAVETHVQEQQESQAVLRERVYQEEIRSIAMSAEEAFQNLQSSHDVFQSERARMLESLSDADTGTREMIELMEERWQEAYDLEREYIQDERTKQRELALYRRNSDVQQGVWLKEQYLILIHRARTLNSEREGVLHDQMVVRDRLDIVAATLGQLSSGEDRSAILEERRAEYLAAQINRETAGEAFVSIFEEALSLGDQTTESQTLQGFLEQFETQTETLNTLTQDLEALEEGELQEAIDELAILEQALELNQNDKDGLWESLQDILGDGFELDDGSVETAYNDEGGLTNVWLVDADGERTRDILQERREQTDQFYDDIQSFNGSVRSALEGDKETARDYRESHMASTHIRQNDITRNHAGLHSSVNERHGYYPARGAFTERANGHLNAWDFGRPTEGRPSWVSVQLESSEVLGSYRLHTFQAFRTAMPKSWQLQASHNGSSWVTLDERNNVSNWTSNGSQLFWVHDNEVPYQNYRLLITDFNGYHEGGLLGEIDLYNQDDLSITQDAARGGTAISSYGQNDGYYPAQGAFSNIAQGWGNAWSYTPRGQLILPQWITYEMPEERRVQSYNLHTFQNFSRAMPRHWRVYGSDNGQDWNIIDDREETNWPNNDFRNFDIDDPQSYRYYKLEILSYNGYMDPNGHGAEGLIGEIDYLEDPYYPWRRAFEEFFAQYVPSLRGLDEQELYYSPETLRQYCEGLNAARIQQFEALEQRREDAYQSSSETRATIDKDINTVKYILNEVYLEHIEQLEERSEQLADFARRQLERYATDGEAAFTLEEYRDLGHEYWDQQESIVGQIEEAIERVLAHDRVGDLLEEDVATANAFRSDLQSRADGIAEDIEAAEESIETLEGEIETAREAIATREARLRTDLQSILEDIRESEDTQIVAEAGEADPSGQSGSLRLTQNSRFLQYEGAQQARIETIEEQLGAAEGQVGAIAEQLESAQERMTTLQTQEESYAVNVVDRLSNLQMSLIQTGTYVAQRSLLTEEAANIPSESLEVSWGQLSSYGNNEASIERALQSSFQSYISRLYQSEIGSSMSAADQNLFVELFSERNIPLGVLMHVIEARASARQLDGREEWLDAQGRIIFRKAIDASEDFVEELFVYDPEDDASREPLIQFPYGNEEPQRQFSSILFQNEKVLIQNDGQATYIDRDGDVIRGLHAFRGGAWNSQLYDMEGHVIAVVDGEGTIETYGYEDEGTQVYRGQEAQRFMAEDDMPVQEYQDAQGRTMRFDLLQGELLSVQQENGQVLEDIVLNEDDSIASAVLVVDGRRYYYEENVLQKMVFEGVTTYYQNGRIDRVDNGEGTYYFYTYMLDDAENVIEIRVQSSANPGQVWVYDSNMEFQSLEQLDGSTLALDGQVLTLDTGSASVVTQFDDQGRIEELQNGSKTWRYLYSVTGIQITETDSEDREYETVHFYDTEGVLLRQEISDGTEFRFNEDGVIVEISTSVGEFIRRIVWDDDGQMRDYQVFNEQDELQRVYEAYQLREQYTEDRSREILTYVMNDSGESVEFVIITEENGVQRIYDIEGNLVERVYTNAEGEEQRVSYGEESITIVLPDVTSVYDEEGELQERSVGEGSVSHFEDGRMTEITNVDGEVIVSYDYDSEGLLQGTRFEVARRQLEADIGEAESRLEEEIASRMSQLEDKEAELEAYLDTYESTLRTTLSTQMSDQRELINSHTVDQMELIRQERIRLLAIQRQRSAMQTEMGSNPSEERTQAFEAIFEQVDLSLERLVELEETINDSEVSNLEPLWESYQNQLGILGDRRAEEEERISTELSNARRLLAERRAEVIATIESQRANALAEIERGELREMAYYHYRSVLGREVSDAELDELDEDITGTQLRTVLVESDEYTARQSYKAEVIASLRAWMDHFLAATSNEQEGLLQNFLGLSPSDNISMPSEDLVTQLFTYLEGQTLHFADTAVIPLRNLLGNTESKALLLQKLILTDFLSANLTAEEMNQNGRLKLSFYAMQQVASLYDQTLYGQDISFDAFEEGSYEDTIIHFNRDHFVELLRIDEETVTYFEASRGPNGRNVIMDRSEFEAQVSGHVLVAERIDSASDMSLSEMKEVKGSGFWKSVGNFFKKVFRGIGRAVEFVVDAVVNIVTAPIRIIQAVSDGNWKQALMETAMFAINFVPAVGQAIGGAIRATVGSVLQGIGHVVGMFSSGLQTALTNMATNLGTWTGVMNSAGERVANFNFVETFNAGWSGGITSVWETARNSVARVTAEGATEAALTELGVDESLARIGGSFAGGGISFEEGSATPSFDLDFALSGATAESIREIGEANDWNPYITNVAAVVANSAALNARLPDNNAVTPVYDAFVQSSASQILNYGLDELAERNGFSNLEIASLSIAGEALFEGVTGNDYTFSDRVGNTIAMRIDDLTADIYEEGLNNIVNDRDADHEIGSFAVNRLQNYFTQSVGAMVSERLPDLFEGVSVFFGGQDPPTVNGNIAPGSELGQSPPAGQPISGPVFVFPDLGNSRLGNINQNFQNLDVFLRDQAAFDQLLASIRIDFNPDESTIAQLDTLLEEATRQVAALNLEDSSVSMLSNIPYEVDFQEMPSSSPLVPPTPLIGNLEEVRDADMLIPFGLNAPVGVGHSFLNPMAGIDLDLTWQEAWEATRNSPWLRGVLDFSPFYSTVQDYFIATTGQDLLGHNTPRWMGFVGFVLPGVSAGMIRTASAVFDRASSFIRNPLRTIENLRYRTYTRTITSEQANQIYVHGPHPSYLPNTVVRDFTSTQTERFVRVYAPGDSRQLGTWLVRESELMRNGRRMTRAEIRIHLALTHLPTRISDVTVPAGIPLRESIVNPLPGTLHSSNVVQYEIVVDNIDDHASWFARRGDL